MGHNPSGPALLQGPNATPPSSSSHLLASFLLRKSDELTPTQSPKAHECQLTRHVWAMKVPLAFSAVRAFAPRPSPTRGVAAGSACVPLFVTARHGTTTGRSTTPPPRRACRRMFAHSGRRVGVTWTSKGARQNPAFTPSSQGEAPFEASLKFWPCPHGQRAANHTPNAPRLLGNLTCIISSLRTHFQHRQARHPHPVPVLAVIVFPVCVAQLHSIPTPSSTSTPAHASHYHGSIKVSIVSINIAMLASILLFFRSSTHAPHVCRRPWLVPSSSTPHRFYPTKALPF